LAVLNKSHKRVLHPDVVIGNLFSGTQSLGEKYCP
jgi:hypothetical protein